MQHLLEVVVREMAAFFGADAALVLLRRDDRLAPAAWVGLPTDSPPEMADGTGRDLRRPLERLLTSKRCRDFMSAAMGSGQARVGELVLCSTEGNRPSWGAEDREMLKFLAHQVGVAVVYAQLLERAHGQQQAMARIAAALAGEVEVRKIAQTAVDLAVAELGADGVVVWMARPEARELELLASTGFDAQVVAQVARLSFDAPALATRTATDRRIHVVERLEQLPEELETTRQIFARVGMQSAVDVPLLARGRLMGVLSYVRKAPHRWDADEQLMVSTLADLLAAALLNAGLYEESQEMASRLRAANQQLVQANLRSSELADLAQRRAAELEATIDNIADAVFVCDPEGRITFTNGAALEMIGAERSGELRTLVDYIAALRPRYPDGRPIPREDLAISRALRGEVVRGLEELVYDSRLRQDRHILVSAAPVRDPEGNFLGAVQVLSDITRFRELDQLKDQFITVAAHEIKTPVTAIKGFAQTLLRTPGACSPKYQRALETIVQQSDRIDALVRDFLEISRMRWGRVKLSPERIDLAALVADAVERRAAKAPRHQLLLTRKDPAWVDGDRERLNLVLEKLLDNAVRFSPQGGRVEVQLRREGSRAVVSILDRGVGIPKEKQAHMFDRFYRAHMGTPHDYGGLGIGLFITQEIVRQHGGEVWFESKEGKGSTFYFSLPLAHD